MKTYIRRLSAFVLFAGVVAFAPPIAAVGQTRAPAAGAPATADQRALKEKVEARFDVLPISDGIALRPKTRIEGVHLIEIVNSTIEIDGVAIGGRELRDKLRADAPLLLQLSYLDSAQLRELFAPNAGQTPSTGAPAAGEPSEPSEPQPPERTAESERTYTHESHGDRVRIMGSVRVDKGERIHGGAVAVLGSAHVDGDVNGDVVAVLGNVELGPGVRVGGNAVSVGGRVIRGEGAQVNGEITEVSIGQGVRAGDVHISPVWGGFYPWGPWGRTARLFGTIFRVVLLLLLTALIAVVAPRVVENAGERVAAEPLKSFGVGLAAQLLFIPVLIVTCIVLVVSIVGIPVLILVPFAILGLLLAALVGFTGAAYTAGHFTSRRFGWGAPPSVVGATAVGVLAIVALLVLGRLVGLVGGPIYAFAVLLVILGFCIEYIAWATGFGAALINLFTGWRARRAAKRTVTTTTTTTTTTPDMPPAQG